MSDTAQARVNRVADDYANAWTCLERLRKFDHYDWDDEGAAPISKDAIDRALTVVEILRHESTAPAPKVIPTPDGGVSLAWKVVTSTGCLEIESRLSASGDQFLIGYAHLAGFEADEPIRDPSEIAQRVRDRLKANHA